MGWDKNADEKAPGKKESLPEVMEQDLGGDNDTVIDLLGRAINLDEQMEVLKTALKEALEELGALAATHGLDGFRHGKVVYTQRLQDGKKTVNKDKMKENLVAAGIDIDVMDGCIADATKQGESFWVREIGVLKEKKAKKGE